MKDLISTFLLLFCISVASGQKSPSAYRPGEILLQLDKGQILDDLLADVNSRQTNHLYLIKPVHAASGIYLLGYDEDNWDDEAILEKVHNHPSVYIANFNRYTYDRATEPDDPIFPDQWHLDLIKAPEAWDVTTGGISPRGDTIVVAVLDGGCQLDHIDLANNIWRNWAEIPDDGIDNDGNGYTDDHFGLNTATGNDNHPEQNHGTSVTGIIGAQGNNNRGLSGVNWNIKLMILSKVNTEAEVVEAYMYVYEQRKKYNDSQGAEGSFVVATNYSLGIDFQSCNSFTLWNSALDTLGTVGVLSAGAVANQNADIDAVGDVPGTCQSEFLITVTNINEDDEKELVAAFGSTNLDLGAPGSGSLTTVVGDQYGTFAGTSAAAPHVAGAIALMYSVPCSGLSTMAFVQPMQAARRVKEFILDGTDPIPSLSGRSVSGGRLNIFQSIELMQEAFADPRGSLQIMKLQPNPVDQILFLDYKVPDFIDYDVHIFSSSGKLMLHQFLPAVCGLSPYPIDVSHFAAGAYFLRIYDGENYVTEKFVVY